MMQESNDTRRGLSRWQSASLMVRAVQVRLRFVAVLAVTFVIVGQWETLRARWDRLSATVRQADPQAQAVSTDSEYFCPMDPGVVSDWPGKCGACNMVLVRRKKGEQTPLPSGVVARMQLSPYRVQLAGIRTATVAYKPLAREVVFSGIASGIGSSRTVEADVFERDLPLLAEGQAAELDGVAAKVKRIDPEGPRIQVEADDPARLIRPGSRVAGRVRMPVADLEPFRSIPAVLPMLRKGEARTIYICPEHAEVNAEKAGKCPIDPKDTLEPRRLQANQRLGWWCPMHPRVQADHAGVECKECNGMPLLLRVVTYRPEGQVLAVPESAVVQTGTRSVVYVERMAGMFDGVEVVLGPRCGDDYPVVSGIEPGQRIASAGAFLLDAETRLNPSLAASYFGAGRGTRSEEVHHAHEADSAQQNCPVTGKPLGSMGTPVSVTASGRTVLLCCKGCESAFKKDPAKYISKLP
jgi:membrane fusion protein, copper/silver efflux system